MNLLNIKKNSFIYTLYCCIVLTFISYTVYAEKDNAAFIREHLAKTVYSIDTEAKAVVLDEKTIIRVMNNDTWYEVRHVYRMMKILAPSAVEYASIKISPLPDNSSVTKIRGATYNLINNKVEKSELSRSSIYEKNIYKKLSEVTFTLPDVRAGAIIEYSYDITTPLSHSLSPWLIQEEYPKLHSEYEIVVSKIFDYVNITQGTSFKDCKTVNDADVSYHVANPGIINNEYTVLWGQRNIPSISSEPLISCVENYSRRIDVQLSGISIPGWQKESIYKSWDMLDKGLLANEYFGEKISNTTKLLEKTIDSVIAHQSTSLLKAKAIFSFFRSFTCNTHYGIYSRKNINALLQNKVGDGADINLLLVASLRYAGITAAPVVLSQLGKLQLHEYYPITNRLNYVVCRASIDEIPYYLDATDKYNPFGVLPLYCYNGYSRVVDKKGEGVYLTSNSINEKNMFVFNISGLADTNMKIDISGKLGLISSAAFRREWQKDSSYINNYTRNIAQMVSEKSELLNLKIDNLEDADTTLTLKFTINVKNNTANNFFYLKTEFIKQFNTNPFMAAHRTLPVEFGHKNNFSYIMTAFIPEKYALDELPKSIQIGYKTDQLLYNRTVHYDSSMHLLYLNTSFTTNNTMYKTEDYSTLRIFFEKLVQEGNATIAIQRRKD